MKKTVARNSGQRALLKACGSGNIKEVHRLLSEGIRPQFQDAETGDNPLRAAAENGHLSIVKLLLDAGADPDLPRNMEE